MERGITPRPRPYWSASVLDVRSLALFRILLGLYLIYDVYSRLSLGIYDLEWYTSDGYLDPDDTPHRAPLHRIWFYRGHMTIQATLFAGTVIVILAFLVYDSWLVKVGLFVSVTSFQNRNMWVHDGSDSFFRHLLLWSIFLPLHEVWSFSVPSYGRTVIVLGSNRQRKFTPQSLPPASVTSLACGALTLQIALMYCGTVANRILDNSGDPSLVALLFDGSWRQHQSEWMPPQLSAVFYILHGSFATRNHWLVKWLRSHPHVTSILTASAMITEAFVPLLCLFDPKRRHWYALQLAFLHVGLLIMMRLPNWQFVGLLVNVVWIPTTVWDALLGIDRAALAKKKDLAFDAMSVESNAFVMHDQLPVSSQRLRQRKQISFALQLFFVLYSVHDWCGCRGWIPKLDEGDVGEGLRISQYWVMFGTVSHTAHNVHLTGIIDNGENEGNLAIDLLQFLSTGKYATAPSNGTFLSDMSDRYPSPRWERALSQWATKRDIVRGQRLASKLCSLLPIRHLQLIQVRYSYAKILPPGSEHRLEYDPRKREVVSNVLCHGNTQYR